ncbi:MAG: M16 family metallopeptidase [Myxococcales bacterium]
MRFSVLGKQAALLFGAVTVASTAAMAAPPLVESKVLGNSSTPSSSTHKEPSVVAIEQWVGGLKEKTLPNGLRVIMAPDVESPTVSVCVTYDVGSRNELDGQSGFAHLFEHMMFQGSKNVKKGEHFQLVTARGGQLNGTTSADRTNYFETLPSQELELGLWLEADRMRWLDVSATNFENQRAVVKEEYRMRVENAAYHPALIELERLVFAGYSPYEHPTIGSMAALDAAKLEWVRDFHAQYYGPNNAVLTISGGFSADQAIQLVEKYFAPIPPVKVPALALPPVPPPRSAEHRATVTDKNAKTPALLVGWRIPPSRDKDHYALEMAARLLADGESSLLYESMVRRTPLAREVSAFTYDHRGPDAFVITVEFNADSKPGEIEHIVDRHLRDLAEKGPNAERLNRVKQRVKSNFVFGLQSNQARATTLGEYATFYRDPHLIAADLDALLQVSVEDIRSVVARHLLSSSRIMITVEPVTSNANPPATRPVQKESR